jgi:putative tricarboxylic transport membrane protein
MAKKETRELYTNIFFLVLSVAYFIGTLSIDSFSPFGNRGLDSQSIPQVLALLLFGFSIMKIVLGVRKINKERSLGNKDDSVSRVHIKINKKLILCIALLAVYALLFDPLGFIISSCLYLFSMIFMLSAKEKRTKMLLFLIPFSIIVPVLIYVLFSSVLGVILPRGILGF